MGEALFGRFGYAALVLVLFLDGSGIPWPTEATLVATGAYTHSLGLLQTTFAAIASLAGAALGSAFSYYLGRRMGPAVLRKILTAFRLTEQHIQTVDQWLARHGHRAVFFGRMIPFVRNFIGFPAGIMGIPFPKYMVYSLSGYGLYIFVALSLGYGGSSLARWLGDLEVFLWILGPLALIVAWFKWGRKWLKQRRGRA